MESSTDRIAVLQDDDFNFGDPFGRVECMTVGEADFPALRV